MQPPRHRRRRRSFRKLKRFAFIALLVMVLLPSLPWLAVALFVDVDTVRAQVETAALRATGRSLSLGNVTMLRSLPPTIAAQDVGFANAPGGSRPDMLRVPYAEATLGMLPLLFGRLEISSLVLSRPDLMLEIDPAGTGNWQFTRRPGDLLADRSRHSRRPRWARRHAAQERVVITLEALRIREGRIAWRDDVGAWSTVDIRRLDAAAPGMDDRVVLTAQVVYAERTVNVSLNTGPLARLRDAASTTPWPVRLELETPGAHAGIVGTLSRPRELRGYTLAIEGTAENLGELQGLLHTRLPPFRKLVFKTRLADSGGAVPVISGISLRARESDLNAWVPGLKVADLDLAAESFDSPVRAELNGVFDRRPLHLAAALGAPAALFSPAPRPGRLPLDVAIEAAGGWLTIKGGIAMPDRGTGLDLDVAGAIPDLGALSPLIGQSLPAFRDITLGLHAEDGEGGFRRGVALRNIVLRSSEADLAGELDLLFAGRTAIRAVLNGRNLDIDALRAAMQGTGTPPPAPAPARAVAASGWLIPSDRLSLDGLGRADLDLHASVAEVRLGGALLRDASLVVGLHDGQLTVDPLSAALPNGGIELRGALNAHGRLPPMRLSVRAAGVPAQPVFGALGLPDDGTGTMTLTADLNSAGASLRELAAGLSGQVGLAMLGATLDNRLLEGMFGPALRTAGVPLPGADAPAGRSEARCLAVRLNARDGVVALHDLVLDTPSLLLQGDGALQLRDERVAVRLTLTPRGGGRPAPVVRIGGVFARTTIYPEQRGAAPGPGPGAQPCADAQALAGAVASYLRQHKEGQGLRP
jgi:uncharacterized protein involved in outer membrane biogenesis